MGSVGFLESKEEIFAKKLHLGNRIRATFGASGDHDAVERIALGEARASILYISCKRHLKHSSLT